MNKDEQLGRLIEDWVNELRLRVYLRQVDRRTFLKALGLGSAGVTLAACNTALPDDFYPMPTPTPAPPPTPTPFVPATLRELSSETLELYASEFQATRGTSQGFSFHCVNCRGNCAWETYAQDGRIVREEQVALYPQINPTVPDANPRGCNKGAIHSRALYEKDRLLYPLKRVGKRGEGQWKRISWDEALTEVAEKIVDTMTTDGPGKLMIHAGTGILSPGRRASALRLGSLLGAVRLFAASAVGDMLTGASLAYGMPLVGHTSEAWFEADYVLIMAINPTVSRIPDAHYLWEGKYRGARIVTISPDYNPTARQSSLWMPIKPGTDSFLVMSLVHAIFKEQLYDGEFIREQTDLPFLVKTQTGKLLRQSDMMEGGSDQVFYFYDEAGGRPVEAPGSMGSDRPTLRLDGVTPALEGVFTVRNATGQAIEVTTVFEMVRREADRFSPEETQQHTGIHPSLVYDEARRFAHAKTAIIMAGFQLHKYFWGTLACWGAALLLALTGHAGRRGGLDVDNEWALSGVGALSSPKPPRFGSGFLGEWMDGDMAQSFTRHYDDGELKARTGLSTNDIVGLARATVEEKRMPYFGKPRVMLLFFDNRFVRNSAQAESTQAILEPVELYVNVNYRLDSSALFADIVLPSFTNYETWEIRADVGYSRFANLMIPPEGLKPPGETKAEWEICLLLSQKIEEVATARGVSRIEDAEYQVTRDLDTLHRDFVTVDGREISQDSEVLEWMLETAPQFRGWSLKMAGRTGFIPLNELAGQISPLYPDRPYYAFEKQVYLKRPYATLSGRQQFYVDHDLYLQLGCATPTAREPVRPGKYPLAYYTPHSRYGIHSTWRAGKYHLRLQRGVPHVYINPRTAEEKGIADGDTVRVFNDVGEMVAMAKLHPGTPPDAVWTEHAWENFQFKDGKGYNNVVAGILTPMELVGDYGHLTFSPSWDGNQLASEASVDIEKVT